ncbi:MAG: protein translocase subunit SecD [Pseudomonadota bacterium]
MHFSATKKVFVLLVCLWGILYALPNVLPETTRQNMAELSGWLPSKTISLGLDLQGGSHILMQVEMDSLIDERIESLMDGAVSEFRDDDIAFERPTKIENGFQIRLVNTEQDREAAYKIASGLEENLEVETNDNGIVTVQYGLMGLTEIQDQTISQSLEIVRRRIDETGTKEPVIQRQGTDRILLQLPGVDDPEEIKRLLGRTAKLSFHLVDENATSRTRDTKLLPMREQPGQRIAVNRRSMISGDMITNAQPAFDQNNRPIVSFQLNAVGAKRFCDVTTEHTKEPFAIVLDKEVVSAPVIQSRICGGRGQISGGFSVEEATNLAILIRAGALPAPLKIMEERTVGPSLGADSIEAGKTASLVGLALVFIYILLSYGLFGLFANISLFLNIALIFALLSTLQATLTLPGIAGIVLTIGMAVDANVLIFERIREEYRLGRSIIGSIDSGYKQSLSTIVDANITTLIAALLLFSFGSGPIKGFAVTLGIGIITSMFSAVLLSRLIVITWLNKTRPQHLPI